MENLNNMENSNNMENLNNIEICHSFEELELSEFFLNYQTGILINIKQENKI